VKAHWERIPGWGVVGAIRHRLTPARQVMLAYLALAGAAIGIEIGLLSDSLGAPGVPPTAFTLILTMAAGLLLLFHRRAPLTVLAFVLVIEGVLAAAGSYPGGAPALIALGAVALYEERRRSVPALVVTAIVLQVGSISAIPVPVLAWAVGAYAQTRLRYVAALAERAHQLEREREQRDVIAAQAERTGIARELHDIVAHSVTVMLLGVRGARDALRSDPDQAEEALRRVEKSGEESIEELRRMLSVLRGPAGGDDTQFAPAPTLAQVPELVERHREAGMPVTLTIAGETRSAGAGVELTGYRVIQEGLTNVARHAGRPDRVEVAVTYCEECLEVAVTNRGRPGAATGVGTGTGLRGLRERVTAAGGELTAEPLPDHGFLLFARLPRNETP